MSQLENVQSGDEDFYILLFLFKINGVLLKFQFMKVS